MSEQKALVFAIDFDGTFTADRELWSCWIKNAQSRGHRVYCVTARRDDGENREILSGVFAGCGVNVPIIFSNLGSKMHTMEKRGIKVDVWIDDAPHALVHGM